MKILFCGGGTAGHVTPNLAICDFLMSPEGKKLVSERPTLYYVGGSLRDKSLVEPYVTSGKIVCYRHIDAYKFRRSLSPSNLLLPFRLATSVRQARKILQELSPDVVFSKGGYVGLPVVIAARQEGIRTVLHESDMSLGLANKICMRFADEKLSAFPIGNKTKCVGLPIRRGLTNGVRAKGLEQTGFDGKKPLLLVVGGSLGAASLNAAIVANPALADKFDIFVLTGKGKRVDCGFVHQAEYVPDPSDLFAAADVCLTRAGSTTLCELTLCSVPFVAVPLASGSRGEQAQNADYFAKAGCGIIADNDGLSETLPFALDEAYVHGNEIRARQKQLAILLDGTERCARVLLGL